MIIGLSISFLAFISAAIIKIYKSIVGFVEPEVDSNASSVTRYDSVGSNYDINDLEAEAKDASIKAEQSKEEAAKAEMLDSDNFADLVKQADADKAEADRANKNLADARNKLDDLLDQTEADRIKADRNLADANSEIADLERRLSEAMAELEAADLTAAAQEAKIRRSISSYKMKADKATEEEAGMNVTDFDKRITALTIAIKSLEIAKVECYYLENLTGATPATANLINGIKTDILNLQNNIVKTEELKKKYRMTSCEDLGSTNPDICKNRIDCLYTQNEKCKKLVCDTMPVDNRCSDQPGCKIGTKQRCRRERKSCARQTNQQACKKTGCDPKYANAKGGQGDYYKCQGVSEEPMPACKTITKSNGEFGGCEGSDDDWGDCVGGHWMTWCVDNK